MATNNQPRFTFAVTLDIAATIRAIVWAFVALSGPGLAIKVISTIASGG